MKSLRVPLCLTVLFCLLTLLGLAKAAEFSPALDYELSHSKSSDFVSAIVILESPIDIRALDERLHVEKATKAKRHADVLAALHYNADQTQPKFRLEFDQAIADGQMKAYTPYWIENLFVVFATKDFIEGLRPRGDVKYVTENFKAELIEPLHGSGERGVRNPLDTRTLSVGIDEVGARRINEELGLTGSGVLIGDCDTGADGTHPAFAARWRGNFAPWWQCWKDNANHNTQFPNDLSSTQSHGTHTLGTMTGRGVNGTDTTWVGCAPNARWMCNNAIRMNVGSTFDNEIISSYQWFTDPDTVNHSVDAVPDVINNSWGVNTGLGYVQCYDHWNSVMLNCEAGGSVVMFAAGNEASSGLRSPAIYSINSWQFFSVGAVDGTTNTTPPYPIASFSSRGPTPCTPANPNNIKPEISAPGYAVYSSVSGGTYSSNWSGTSMATPHVSGIVALMREACPTCDPQTIKTTLMNTAIRTGYVTPPATENNTFGNGFVDGYAAVLAVYNLGRVSGFVRDVANNPIAGVTVRNVNGSQNVITDATGSYVLPLSAGTYTLGYSKTGYFTQNISGVVVVQGVTTTQDMTLNALGRVMGTVRDANTNAPLAAAIQSVGGTESTVASAAGNYVIILAGDSTYTLRYSMTGYTSADRSVHVLNNDTTLQDVSLTPRPVVTSLSEDFENGAPNWTHTSAGGTWVDQWNINTQRSHSATHAYKCGDVGTVAYANFNDARLTSPVIPNLPDGTTLHFWYQIEAEISAASPDSAYDGGIVEISANGGAFTQIAPIGGYPKTFRFWRNSSGNPATGPMLGQPCFSGNVTTWTEAIVDLSAYAGQSLQIRFRFGSDQSTGAAGWFVDDVTVSGYGDNTPATPNSVVISLSGTDLILSWPADGNTLYRIYSDTNVSGSFSTLVGTSNTNQYTVVGGATSADKTFYIVRGWNGQ